MTEEFFAAVGDRHATQLHVVAGERVWYVEAVLDDSATDITGQVVVTLGSRKLHGTVQPNASGDFVLAGSLRIVAGAGGWGTLCEPRQYHDDAGVDAESIARDAAAEAGETLVEFDPAEPTLEPDFVRGEVEASAVLEQAIGAGRSWWVDPDGNTRCGVRPAPEAPADSYELLTYSPLTRRAELALNDPGALWVSMVITDRLAEPQTIRELEIHVEIVDGVPSCRAIARTGAVLSDSLDAVLEQRESKRLYGTYRYRVVAVESDSRLQLQAVRQIPGLPDVLPASQVAGIASAVSTPDLGTIVRVAFDEGDPQLPYVAGWPAGDPSKAAGIARMSDLVTCGGEGTVAVFSLGPMAGAYTAPVLALGSPTGAVPVVMAGVPYLVSFSDVVSVLEDPSPPTIVPPKAEPLLGYILSASEKGAIE